MQKYPLVSKVKINRARSEFFSRGVLPTGLVPETIVRSWQRSIANGIDAEMAQIEQPILSRQELDHLTFRNRLFLEHSRPVMENLYEQIQDTSSIVILADKSGVILDSLGDVDFIDRARRVSLQPGGVWSEEFRGTNAIGTALVEQLPVRVNSGEHFAAVNSFLSCSASPVFDPYGTILGILDVSGDYRSYQQHTMALVQISAQQIENQMFASGFEEDVVFYFHRRPEFIGSLYEAIAVFTSRGKLKAANRSALLHLGLDRYNYREVDFAELFDMPFHSVISREGQVLPLCTCNDTHIFGRWRAPLSGARERTVNMKVAGPSSAELTLETLDLGDSMMRRAIEKVHKVLGHAIPVLLEGESGTGKELFARAMHNSGPRRSGSFVALNCAAIPEGLIEAELFGYQEGAFTGAKRKGQLGRIRQADGGTLFLDEIGDMPLALQARLLRVLQQREVTPLGGSESLPVDIAVICATNRKLREEVAAGRFREDLYYRLNGLLVSLPSLRNREDRLNLARAIAGEIGGPGRSIRISEEVRAIFDRHPWPGNIRQLHSILRTAVALLGDDREITAEHLSEDFLEQYRETFPSSAEAGADAGSSLLAAPVTLDRLEIMVIRKTLDEHDGNISATARRLGVSRNTLYRRLREHPLC
ncbi:sigma-54-dependent Fis family transcriptional regulator [Geobacter argillaceus]|uniref:GAF modulated sigma54 specific transcriptional regulator, Fis family n=1 Tax=Geobacter argillaceus TaxID=345631 RepID=A0A562VMM3_9BACT|nr:sigma-54-dependent Fis family transcriptional regulator [Geobacter argillaceus]TWJ19138.1 GAF modulated sigma54 specific transcriptional regulator, Fis family [Geobacter argillaceus]